MEFEHPQIESARIMLENVGYTVTKKSELPLGHSLRFPTLKVIHGNKRVV